MKRFLGIITAAVLCTLMITEPSVCFAADNLRAFAYDNSTAEESLYSPQNQTQLKESDYAEGEVIVMLKKSAAKKYMSKTKTDAVYGKGIMMKNSFDAKSKKCDMELKGVCLKSSTKSTQELIEELENDSSVDCVFPNYYMEPQDITDDPYSGYQWALDNTGQQNGTEGKDTNADALWDRASPSTSEDSVVAVIDTGIDAVHEDLKDVLWENTTSLPGTYGYDFINNDAVPEDTNGHGTHCAGIIAASANNSKGISGISTSKTRIMALKVDNVKGEYSTAAIWSAFSYISDAVDNGVNVVAVNCSFGSIEKDSEYKSKMEDWMDLMGSKGVITCVSAGNQSINLNTLNSQTGEWLVPACCESDYKICVAAVNENDSLAWFSNRGNKYVDVAAPGTHILSTVPENTFVPSIYSEDKRDSLCAYYQDFSDFSDTSAFGLNFKAKAFNGYSLKISDGGDDSFGKTKGSLKIESADGNYGSGFDFYLEFPYTVSNSDDDYYISFKRKYLGEVKYVWNDKNSDYDTDSKFDSITNMNTINSSPQQWRTGYTKREPSQITDFSVSRKIILCFKDVKGPVLIDDIGISKQGISESSLGKYDFKDGTSMASPFAAGAVALLKSVYPDCGVLDIANMIKTKGRRSSSLLSSVNNGCSLSLDDTDSYFVAETEPAQSTEATKPTQATETTEPTQATETTEHTQVTEATEPTEVTEATKPTQTTEATKLQPIVVPAVTGLVSTGSTKDSVSLMWNSVDVQDVRYSVEYRVYAGIWYACPPVSTTSLTVTGLSSSEYYYFRIRAVVQNKYGKYSSAVAVKTDDVEITLQNPNAKKPVKSDMVGSGAIKLFFSNIDIAAEGVEYAVYNGSGAQKESAYIAGNQNLSATVSGLKRNQFYSARARAYRTSPILNSRERSIDIFGAWSSKVYFALGVTPTLNAKKSGITVKWARVIGAQNYTVYYAQKGKSFKKYKTVKSMSLTIGKKLLKKNKKYRVKVVANKGSAHSLSNTVKTVKAK